MKIFTLSILLILFACKNNKDENQNEFNKQKENSKIELRLKNELIKNQNFALKKLKLKPISKLNSKTLRIWRFPGGGAIFEEIYELNIDEKELKKIKANAARRITKIESSLAKYDEEMAVIDEDMLANGRDRGKLYDLQKDKDALQAKIDKLYAEYEEQINLL